MLMIKWLKDVAMLCQETVVFVPNVVMNLKSNVIIKCRSFSDLLENHAQLSSHFFLADFNSASNLTLGVSPN